MLTVDSIRSESKLPDDFHKRRGWFRVSSSLLDLQTTDLMRFMSHFLVVKAEFQYDKDAIEYTAISELFEPIDNKFDTPEYTFTITKDNSAILKVKAHRVRPVEGDGLLRLLRKLDG